MYVEAILIVLRECLSRSGVELFPYTTTLPQLFHLSMILFREVMTLQNSSDQKRILILSDGAGYTISLYVLSTHPNYTALTIQFKESRKISTGKNVYFGVHCFCMV